MADKPTVSDNKPKNKITIKQRIILLVTCPVIVILLCSVAIVITVHQIEADGPVEETTAPDIILEPVSEFFSSPQSYCADFINKASAKDDIKVTSGIGVSIHDIGGDFSSDVFSVINNVLGQITDKAKSKYESFGINYGESGEKLKEIAKISDKVSDCSGEGKNTSMSYTLTIPVDSDGIAAFKSEDEKVFAFCLEECASSVKITDEAFVLDSATAYYNYDTENEWLTSFEIVREYKFSGNAEFLGGLAAFGSGKISFGVRVNTKYNITHAGIFIQDELTLTKHGFQTLSMKANVADDALSDEDAQSEGITDENRIFTVEFFSSDESIATVDKTGMVEAVTVSDKPVTITARLTYHGKVYEDSCTVRIIEEKD